MAGAAAEYGQLAFADCQASSETQNPQHAQGAPVARARRGRRAAYALLSLAGAALLATLVLSSRGSGLRGAIGAAVELMAVQNDPFQCGMNYGEGMGSWETVWTEDQKEWCCRNKKLGCPSPPLFDCTAGLPHWKLGWSDMKKTWCCKRFQKGCPEAPGVCKKEQSATLGPKLFCVMVIRPDGYEPGLVREQIKKCVGAFSCDDFAVVSHERVMLSEEPLYVTRSFKGPPLPAVAGASFNSVNFKSFWETIREDGQFDQADWTIKVDPDSVFFPERLQERLERSAFTPTNPTFFANCDEESKVSPRIGGSFLYGPIEVISRGALDKFFAGFDSCDSGKTFEETFLMDCMKKFGVPLENRDLGLNLLRDDSVQCGGDTAGLPCASNSVVIHPFSGVEKWFKCWDEATASS